MSTFLERSAAAFAHWHARRVYARFMKSLERVDAVQQHVLRRVLSRMAGSDYCHRYGLHRVRTAADLRRAAPLVTYEQLRPYVERLCAGEITALFRPGERIHMFATSSGTTARRKLIPVTSEFIHQYRRGWNTYGLKLLSDHPRAVLRAILQSSGRPDESYTPSGVPCGAITGLLARTQKRIVRRFYVGTPLIACIDDPHARYYTLMRLGVERDVAFAITANPATLIRLAQTADQESERLLRDVRDGTLSAELVTDAALRRRLAAGLRPNPERARELERLRARTGTLRPRDYWQLEFLACWTGGSMAWYLPRLAEWWGPLPVRDVGLLASEGRVTIPLADNTPAGVLDIQAAFVEFVPAAQWDRPDAEALTVREITTGADYTVVLTNSAGLVRYRLDDVVRVRGWIGQAPVLEFLHRAGRVSSVAGEKLTENQVVEAVRLAVQRLGLPPLDFVLTPRWGDPPCYVLSHAGPPTSELAQAVDRALAEQNEEYCSRRKSMRLGGLLVRRVERAAFERLDRQLLAASGAPPEQYKRPCLLLAPGQDDHLLGVEG